MKKILSYSLIFVIVFVNLFAPFSVGINNKIINTKIASAEDSIKVIVEASSNSNTINVTANVKWSQNNLLTNELVNVTLKDSSGKIIEEKEIDMKDSSEGDLNQNGTISFTGLTADTEYQISTVAVQSEKSILGFLSTTPIPPTNLNITGKPTPEILTVKTLSGTIQTFTKAGTQNIDNSTSTSDTSMPECVFTGSFIKGTIAGCFAQIIYYVVFVPTSYLFALSGIFFDNTFAYSVQDTSYRSAFVTEGWGLVRDFCNMFFIFILLYVGISTILDMHKADAKHVIMRVVIIGLFINFSLFVTQVIIDASNVTARVFYNADTIKITEGGNNSASSVTDSGNSKGVISLSAGLVNKVNPQNMIINSKNISNIKPKDSNVNFSNDDTSGGSINAGTFIVVTILAAIINIIGLIVFVSVGLIFVTRIVGLWIAMIVSPLAFFTYIIPSMNNWDTVGWKNWWSNTLKMAFLAPIFIFFLYIILKFLEIDLWGSIQASDGIASVIAIFLPFAFIMVLLMKAKNIATKMSGEMGAYAAKLGSAAGGLALGAATGGVAMLGRSTLGSLGSKIANSSWLAKQEAGGKTAIGRWGAKMALKSGDKLQSSSFDVRNTKVAGTAAGALGTKFGKAQSGGYKADVTNREAIRTKRVSDLKTIVAKGDEIKKRDVEAKKKILENQAHEDIANIDKKLEIARQNQKDTSDPKEKKGYENEIADLKRQKGLIEKGGGMVMNKDKDGKATTSKKNSDGTNRYFTDNGHISQEAFSEIEKEESNARTKLINLETEKEEINVVAAKIFDDSVKEMSKIEDDQKKAIEDLEKQLLSKKSTAYGRKAELDESDRREIENKKQEFERLKTSTKTKNDAAISEINKKLKDKEKDISEANENLTNKTEELKNAKTDSNNGKTFGTSIKAYGAEVKKIENEIHHEQNHLTEKYAKSLGSSTNRFMNVFMSGASKAATDDTRNKILLGMETKKVDGASKSSGGDHGHGDGGHGASAPKAATAPKNDHAHEDHSKGHH